MELIFDYGYHHLENPLTTLSTNDLTEVGIHKNLPKQVKHTDSNYG